MGSKSRQIAFVFALIALPTIFLFQNCGVRRLENADSANLKSLNTTQNTNLTNTGGGNGSDDDDAEATTESCTAAPTGTAFSVPLTMAFKSQDASTLRMTIAAAPSANAASVTLVASSSCIEPSHSCTANTDPGGSCKSMKFSQLTIGFKCSATATDANCGLITPGTEVSLAGKYAMNVNNLVISLSDTTDSCNSTAMKTYTAVDMSTGKFIGGKIRFVRADGTKPGKRIEVVLTDVTLKQVNGTATRKVSGTFFADITCETNQNN